MCIIGYRVRLAAAGTIVIKGYHNLIINNKLKHIWERGSGQNRKRQAALIGVGTKKNKSDTKYRMNGN